MVDFKFQWRISPEQIRIFKIGQVFDFDLPRILPHSAKKNLMNFGLLITGV